MQWQWECPGKVLVGPRGCAVGPGSGAEGPNNLWLQESPRRSRKHPRAIKGRLLGTVLGPNDRWLLVAALGHKDVASLGVPKDGEVGSQGRP